MADSRSIYDRMMRGQTTTNGGTNPLTDSFEQQPSQQNRWFRSLWTWSLLLMCVVVVSVGVVLFHNNFEYERISEAVGLKGAGDPPPPEAAGQSQTSAQAQGVQTPQPGAGEPDPFTVHGRQYGLKACGNIYAALGKALTDGSQFAVQTQVAKSDADKHAVQGTVGLAYKSDGTGYSGPAAGVVFVAPVGQTCEGTGVRVVPLSQNCQAAASLLPAGSKPQTPLSGISVYGLTSGGQVMLFPSGNGCVAISILRAGG